MLLLLFDLRLARLDCDEMIFENLSAEACINNGECPQIFLVSFVSGCSWFAIARKTRISLTRCSLFTRSIYGIDSLCYTGKIFNENTRQCDVVGCCFLLLLNKAHRLSLPAPLHPHLNCSLQMPKSFRRRLVNMTRSLGVGTTSSRPNHCAIYVYKKERECKATSLSQGESLSLSSETAQLLLFSQRPINGSAFV